LLMFFSSLARFSFSQTPDRPVQPENCVERSSCPHRTIAPLLYTPPDISFPTESPRYIIFPVGSFSSALPPPLFAARDPRVRGGFFDFPKLPLLPLHYSLGVRSDFFFPGGTSTPTLLYLEKIVGLPFWHGFKRSQVTEASLSSPSFFKA